MRNSQIYHHLEAVTLEDGKQLPELQVAWSYCTLTSIIGTFLKGRSKENIIKLHKTG